MFYNITTMLTVYFYFVSTDYFKFLDKIVKSKRSIRRHYKVQSINNNYLMPDKKIMVHFQWFSASNQLFVLSFKVQIMSSHWFVPLYLRFFSITQTMKRLIFKSTVQINKNLLVMIYNISKTMYRKISKHWEPMWGYEGSQ